MGRGLTCVVTFLFSLVLLTAAASAGAAAGEDEQAVLDSLERLRVAFQSEDIDAYMSEVSAEYRDVEGYDRDGLRAEALARFAEWRDTTLSYSQELVVFPSPWRADVSCLAVIDASLESDGSPIHQEDGRRYIYHMEGDAWKLFARDRGVEWPAPDAAAAGAVECPDQMTRGLTYTVSVSMENTGETTWTAGGGYCLGAWDPPAAIRWSTQWVDLDPEEAVAPGQSKAFGFEVTAPGPGEKPLSWRMFKEDSGWFGEAATAEVGVHSFQDADCDFWAWADLEAITRVQIATGYGDGCYHPEWVVTRDQMAVFVARALAGDDESVPTGPAVPSFTDVPDDHWAYKYIEYCADPAQDVVHGFGDGSYGPGLAVSRAEMAAYIARAMAGGDSFFDTYEPPEPPTFSDVSQDHWAYGYVEYAASGEVVQGYGDGTYQPLEPVLRDQMAVYICRAFDLAGPPYIDMVDYFPLSQGDRWTMRRWGEWASPEDDMFVAYVSGTQMLDDTEVTVLRQEGGCVDRPLEVWHTISEQEGLVWYGEQKPTLGKSIVYEPPVEVGPPDLAVGDTWLVETTIVHEDSSEEEFQAQVTIVGFEDVATASGTFPQCLRVEYSPTSGIGAVTAWHGYGLGRVKFEKAEGGTAVDHRQELDSAHVGGIWYPFPVSESYWPLAVDNRWEYDYPDPGGAEVIYEVTGSEDIEGNTWYVVDGDAYSEVGEPMWSETVWLRNADYGVAWLKWTGSPSEIAAPGAYLWYPPATGQMWTLREEVDGAQVARMLAEVESVSDTVTVPAGTFRCVRLRMAPLPFPDDYLLMWFAPGVGQVRHQEYDGGVLSDEQVLRSYDLSSSAQQ